MIIMVLLKYFTVEKCARGLPLPDPPGSLNQQLSSTAIEFEEANKKYQQFYMILLNI